MNLGLNDKNNKKSANLLHSFRYACFGIIVAAKSERNMKIHLSVAITVIVFSIVFKLSLFEWLFILFAIGGVIALELVNTAIERVTDLASDDFHPLAKEAKDIAAGAVLVYSILA